MRFVILTTIFALLNIIIIYKLTNRWFSACTWYWLGASLGFIGWEISIRYDWLQPAYSEWVFGLFLQAHLGAFCGFTVISFLFRNKSSENNITDNYVINTNYHGKHIAHILSFALVAVFFLGTIQLLSTGSLDILSLREDYISQAHMVDKLPLHMRINIFIGILGSLAVPYRALMDARNGLIDLRLLLLIQIAFIPGGLVTGGRGWILSVFPPYLLCLLTLSELHNKLPQILKELKKLIIPILVLMLMVSLIKIYRTPQLMQSFYSENDSKIEIMALPILSYLGVPLSACEIYSDYASRLENTYGLGTFSFITAQLRRFNISNSTVNTASSFFEESRLYITKSEHHLLGSTHATLIPHLILDVGESYVWLIVALYASIFQYIVLKCSYDNILAAALILWATWYGSYSVFSSNIMGMSGSIIMLLYAFVLLMLDYFLSSDDRPRA